MNISFYVQFMKYANGTIEPYHKEDNPLITTDQITRIVSKQLGRYGIQHNPYILDFMTVTNELNPVKRFYLEIMVCVLLGCLTAAVLFFILHLSFLLTAGISFFVGTLFSIFCPLTRRFLAESLYVFYRIIICGLDRKELKPNHVMFTLAGKIVLSLNEYLLKYSSPDELLFTDELSVNDFLVNFTSYLKQNVSSLEKLRLCFTPGRRLHKYFLSEKDFIETFIA